MIKIPVVILNGPPGSGKDTLADYTASRLGFLHFRFKTALNTVLKAIYNITDEDLKRLGERDKKEIPQDCLFGKSLREAQIFVSEEIIKPNFGKDYFGKRLHDAVLRNSCSAIVSDGGFEEEVLILMQNPKLDVILFHLYRDGCDFSNDSRDYIKIPGKEVYSFSNIYATQDYFCQAFERVLIAVLKQRGYNYVFGRI